MSGRTRFSRRRLLALGATSLSALGQSSAMADERSPALVFVFLRGAVDGLSALVPHQEKRYYELRPGLAIAPPGRGSDACIDLDGRFGFHPALSSLLPAYRAGELAMIHAVGSRNETRSHFDAQDFLELGTPGRKTGDGWLTRLSATLPNPGDALPAFALETPVPRSLYGLDGVFAWDRLERLRAPGTATVPRLARDGFEAMYAKTNDADAVRKTGADLFALLNRLTPLLEKPPRVAYPEFPFARALGDVARLIRARIAPIFTLSLGDWDTHRGQGGARGKLANQLRVLSESLAAFRADLGDELERVVVLAVTEFGRTVREIGTAGTDHGHGSVMFVLGGGVKGGRVHGPWPGLEDDGLYEGRDLQVKTDHRDVFAEVASKHFAANEALFSGYESKPLGVLG
jgi:uncharacterized protein (DUF1501 family)